MRRHRQARRAEAVAAAAVVAAAAAHILKVGLERLKGLLVEAQLLKATVVVLRSTRHASRSIVWPSERACELR